ncbi:hypothetical protein X474_27975 [Dethiosulfatarculus sandiegensis]|uniref:Uncharacterized protein n=1 Tax=Dethiosulfatarculus sandiegensis TaxID=1429043 RepID=A0A0D2J521_9BACT|nr:hypothetical protein X474_27975 [Dethiosulfatarculus sandiegensis]
MGHGHLLERKGVLKSPLLSCVPERLTTWALPRRRSEQKARLFPGVAGYGGPFA